MLLERGCEIKSKSRCIPVGITKFSECESVLGRGQQAPVKLFFK